MKHLKIYEEYKSLNIENYEDFLFAKVEENEISFRDVNDKFAYYEFKIKEDIDDYLNGKRFSSAFISFESTYEDKYNNYSVFICDDNFFTSNPSWHVENIEWDEHPMAKELKGLDMPALNKMWKDSKIAKIGDHISILSGLNSRGTIEYWDRRLTDDPIFLSEMEESYFQYLLFKSLINSEVPF